MSQNVDPPFESSRSASDARLKLKVYGFLPMTRRNYLVMQVALFVAMVLFFLLVKPILANFQVFAFVYDHFVPFLVVVALLELGETFFMLRRFTAKQKQLAVTVSHDNVQ